MIGIYLLLIPPFFFFCRALLVCTMRVYVRMNVQHGLHIWNKLNMLCGNLLLQVYLLSTENV